jgi:hypothetical protein
MSDTPETDHLENELGQTALQAHPVIWKTSRKLERERDEAQEKAERYRLEANSFMLQRDEARNELLKCNEYNDELYRKLKQK